MDSQQLVAHHTHGPDGLAPLSRTLKTISLILVLMMISVVWSGTIPVAKAVHDPPVAVIGVFCELRVPLEVSSLGGEWDAPCFTEMNDDSYVDIMLWKKGSFDLYSCLYQRDDTGKAHYECFPLLDFSVVMGDGMAVSSEEPLDGIVPVMVDVDNDGSSFKDIVITWAQGGPKLFINTGERDSHTGLPGFSYAGDLLQLDDGAKASAPSFGDLDNDGDQDMICVDAHSRLVLYVSTGNPSFEFEGTLRDVNGDTIPDIPPSQPLEVLPSLIDHDGDGDSDLFVTYGSDEAGYTTLYYRNTGSAWAPEWTREHLPLLEFASGLHCKYLGMVDLNDEMGGLTGRSYGCEDTGRLELVGKPWDRSGLRCFFHELKESDGALSLPATEGKNFRFDGGFSYDPDGPIASYEWDLGDESDPETSPSVSHIYTAVDDDFDDQEERYKDFTVTLKVTDLEENTDELSTTIRVYDSCPEPVITGPQHPGESTSETRTYRALEDSLVFEGDPIDPGGILWDTSYDAEDGFQEDTDYTGMSELDLFWKDSRAECIALRLVDDDGSEAMTVMNIQVLNQRPSCELSLDEAVLITENQGDEGPYRIHRESGFPGGGVPLYAFDVTDPGDDEIMEYRWSVRTREQTIPSIHTTSSGQNAFTLGDASSDEFPNSGTYIIKLRVQDEDGAWSDHSNEVCYTIEDQGPDSANIVVADGVTAEDEGVSIGFSPAEVQTPFDPVTRYEWDFDYTRNEADFRIDAVSSPATDNGAVTHAFDLDTGSRQRDFDVGLRVVDEDGSMLTTSLSEEGYGAITISDTGFCGGGELQVISEDYNHTAGVVEGEGLTFQAFSVSTVHDDIVEYQWDFDYGGMFTSSPVRFPGPMCTHAFTTFREGEEDDVLATYAVAVRVVDEDGSSSDVIVLDNILVHDVSPRAAFMGPECGRPDVPLILDASGSEFSSADGDSYEWDFDYDGHDFLSDEPDEYLAGGGRVVSRSFPEGDHTIALRVSETIKESDNEHDIITQDLVVTEDLGPQLRVTMSDSPEMITSVDEQEPFKLDGTLSEPGPEFVEYLWSYDEGEWVGPTEEKFLVIEDGLSAHEDFVWKYFEEDGRPRPCQLYSLNLRLTREDGDSSTAERSLYVKDSEPDTAITVDLASSSPVVEVVDGIVYTAPGDTVRFTAGEPDDYIDSPVRYLWKQDYVQAEDRYLGEPGSSEDSVSFSWDTEGTYTVAVKKKDADGSVWFPQDNMITVVVTKDTDDDDTLDIFDLDDDGDGVYDSEEVHTKVFETEYTYPISYTGTGDGTCEPVVARLDDVGVAGDVLSVKAYIEVSHDNCEDELRLFLHSSGKTYQVYGGEDVPDHKLQRSLDLLDLRDEEGWLLFRPDNFEHTAPWELRVFDYDYLHPSERNGCIDHFRIEVVHTSSPLDDDTDGDGVSDYEELNFGVDGFKTDPCDDDTDDDGWDDHKEIYEEGTNPTSRDTDGDGVCDPDDIDPHHDVMLKLDIHKFQRSFSRYDDVYFKGNIADREFSSGYVYNSGTSERRFEKNGEKLGVFYAAIDDSAEIAEDGIDVRIVAMDYERNGHHKQLDCAGGSAGEVADFRYYPGTGEIEPVHTNDIDWYAIADDDSYTRVGLSGDTGEGVRVWLDISKTYTDKINTILVGNDGTVVEGSGGRLRYVGEDRLILFHITDSLEGGETDTGEGWMDTEHAIIVPESVYMRSSFGHALDSGEVDYIVQDNSDFLERSYDNPWPRQAKTVIKLKGTDTYGTIPVGSLLEDLTMTPPDEHGVSSRIASPAYLKPYSYLHNDDDHAGMDLVHSIGLPKGILDLIPDDEKSTESDCVRYRMRNVWEWSDYAEDFFSDVGGFLEEKTDEYLNFVYYNSFFRYNSIEIKDSSCFEITYYEGREHDYLTDMEVLSTVALSLSVPVVSLTGSVGPLDMSSRNPYVEAARSAYDEERYRDFIRYPSMGSPQIMNVNENDTLLL